MVYHGLLLAVLLLFSAVTAEAQSTTGFIPVAPSTPRTQCTSIPNPVANQTWCADGSLGPVSYLWKVWNGTTYVTVGGSGGGGGSSQCVVAGQVELSGSTLTLPVVFAAPLADAAYAVALATAPGVGTPPAVVSRYLNRTTTGFTVEISAPSGSGNSTIVSWVAAPSSGCSCAFGQSVTISDPATSAPIIFPTAMVGDYTVALGVSPGAGAPPAVIARYRNKLSTGFTVDISAPPGLNNTIIVSAIVSPVTCTAGGSGNITGSGASPQVTYWLAPTSITGDGSFLFAPAVGLTVIPTANATSTKAGLSLQQTSLAGATRQFLVNVGLTASQGSADTVGLYVGVNKTGGAADVWSLNSVLTQSAASGSYNAQGYEIDVNNLNANRGDTDAGPGLMPPVTYNLTLSGMSTFRKTGALLITDSPGMLNRGIVIANDAIEHSNGSSFQDLTIPHKSIDIRGPATWGIYQSNPVDGSPHETNNWLNGGVILGPVPTGLFPTPGKTGRTLYDATTLTLMCDNGAAWVPCVPTGGGGGGIRTCSIIIGADNGSILVNSDIGPQGKQCFIPAAATVVEVTIAADDGTPSVLPRKINASGSATNLLSGALATAASGGVACANTGGTLGIDGITTCSNTLTTTALAAGVYLEPVSGTAGGVAHRLSLHISYTLP